MSNLLFSLILPLFFLVCNSQNIAKCSQKSPCLCEINSYSKIDISTVVDKGKNLSDVVGPYTYYFLGCLDRKDDGKLDDVSLLIQWEPKHNNTVSNITLQNNMIQFEPSIDKNAYELIYTNGENVTATIRLICDNFDTPFLKVIDVTTHQLVLSSPKVCVITEEQGLSGGSIFLIIFFTITGIYFIGGAVVLYFIRGARGTELIPHIEFWQKLPALVRDGIIFLLNGCRTTHVSSVDTYDRI